MRKFPRPARNQSPALPPGSSSNSPGAPVRTLELQLLEQTLNARVGWLDGLISPFARTQAAASETAHR